MMLKDIIKYSLSNLWHRKIRTSLTILSILIGIAAVIALSSFGLGMQLWIEEFAKEMGTDKIMIMPKDYMTAMDKSNVVFTDDDLDFLKKIQGVDELTGMMFTSTKVGFRDYKERYPYVVGLSTDSKEERLAEEMFGGIEIMDGRALKKGDALKAVLGYSHTVPNKMWKKPVSVGDKIEINNVEVKVVGFYEEIGSPTDDAQIYLSHEGYKEIFDDENYFFIMIRLAPDQNPAELAEKIRERFRKHRDQKEGQEDFFAQTFEEMLATYTTILNVLVGVLVLIALISVLVAAVNIMNTMYTSILERTREIGIMKSIGARNKYIMFIFVIESGLLGLLGGAIGVLLGMGIAKLGGAIAASYGLALLKPAFPIWLTGSALVFSFVVGAVSGLLPAKRASELKPVDALRYE